MITKSLLLMGAMLIAAPVAAQQNTQCYTSVGVTNCTTTGQPYGANRVTIDPNAFQRGYDQSRRAVDSVTESFRQAERDRAQAQSQRVTTQQMDAHGLGFAAGHLIAAGDCAGAQKLALESGNIELVNGVKAYCAK